MPDILIVKDSSTLIPRLGITPAERITWMESFAIYDLNADGSKSGPYGPTTSQRSSSRVFSRLDQTGQRLRAVNAEGQVVDADDEPILTPAGFRWTDHGLTLRRTAAGIVTDFDITDLIPTTGTDYYVDPANTTGVASDVGAGTLVAPLRNLPAALAKTDARRVYIMLGTTDFIARTTASWNNTQAGSSMAIIPLSSGGRFVSINCGSATLPTWAVNGTYSNVYSTTITSANATGVTDLRTRVNHAGVMAMTNQAAAVFNNVAKPFRVLKKVASLAAVSAEAGTWFHDGTQLHVRAHDDRNLVGDTFMQPTANTNNGRFPAASNDRTVYVQGVDFVGGRPFYATVAESAAITGCRLAFNDCTFQGGGLANGLGVEFDLKAYLYRCGAFYNWNDGFNYHCPTAPAALGAATSPDVIEIECLAYGNGTTGSSASSDNASTAHEFTNIIRVNNVYPDSADRVLVDIDSVHSWNLGCIVGAATTIASGKENVAALISCAMWLDSCQVLDGPNPKFASDSSAVLRHYNSGSVANTAGYTGSVKAYYG